LVCSCPPHDEVPRADVPQLFEVAQSTTLVSVLYVSPAWWGFTTAQHRNRQEKLIERLRKGFLPAKVIRRLGCGMRRL